jgi:hypothetical protein
MPPPIDQEFGRGDLGSAAQPGPRIPQLVTFEGLDLASNE